MSQPIDKRIGERVRALAAVLGAGGVLLVGAGSALAGQDQLKGGSVSIQLQNSRGLKFKPRALALPITSGAVDPVNGSGTAFVAGSFKATKGKGKAKVKIKLLTLGANGGPGRLSAKIGKTTVSAFATLAGGTVARTGWGTTISNIRATIARKGAAALTKAFSGGKDKAATKSAAGGVKAGQPLGTITSLTTDPLTVDVVPGTGELVLETDPLGTFVQKLSKHCVDPLPTGSPAGVAPIAPATTTGPGGTTYHFPVAGGTAAPDFSAGQIDTAGGQQITKNSSLLNPGACGSAQPPVGTQLLSTDLGVAFSQNLLNSIPTLPSGPFPRAPLADIDFSTGSRSVDPVSKTLSVTDATVGLAPLAASTLNQVFPTESGNASDDFAAGDAIGKIDLVEVKLR
jgi:hypothetical protein